MDLALMLKGMLTFNPRSRLTALECLAMLCLRGENQHSHLEIDTSYIRTSVNLRECRKMIEREGIMIRRTLQAGEELNAERPSNGANEDSNRDR
jgi:hypothetical protein